MKLFIICAIFLVIMSMETTNAIDLLSCLRYPFCNNCSNPICGEINFNNGMPPLYRCSTNQYCFADEAKCFTNRWFPNVTYTQVDMSNCRNIICPLPLILPAC